MTETPWREPHVPKPVRKKDSKRRGGSVIAASKLAKLAKAFKAAKALKIFLSFGSMILSVFAYSFALGWAFSVGFVVMLFFHEAGHVVALKSKGMKASLPVFVPFLGAAIFAPKLGDRHEEAYMAFGGPLIGSACAVVLFIGTSLAPGTHPLLLAIAFTALSINLFNMIPLSPLDGGRITQAVGPWFRYVGIAALLVLTIALASPGLLVIWVLVLTDLRVRRLVRMALGLLIETVAVIMMAFHIGEHQALWINIIDLVLMSLLNVSFIVAWRKNINMFEEEPDDRPALPKAERNRWLAAYAGLVAALAIMMVYVHNALSIYISA